MEYILPYILVCTVSDPAACQLYTGPQTHLEEKCHESLSIGIAQLVPVEKENILFVAEVGCLTAIYKGPEGDPA